MGAEWMVCESLGSEAVRRGVVTASTQRLRRTASETVIAKSGRRRCAHCDIEEQVKVLESERPRRIGQREPLVIVRGRL
jgi:hypothetical protein